MKKVAVLLSVATLAVLASCGTKAPETTDVVTSSSTVVETNTTTASGETTTTTVVEETTASGETVEIIATGSTL